MSNKSTSVRITMHLKKKLTQAKIEATYIASKEISEREILEWLIETQLEKAVLELSKSQK